jgi:hypothetical protein
VEVVEVVVRSLSPSLLEAELSGELEISLT